jgi:hypothetical protein
MALFGGGRIRVVGERGLDAIARRLRSDFFATSRGRVRSESSVGESNLAGHPNKGIRQKTRREKARQGGQAMSKRSAERVPCDMILNKVQDGHTNIVRATNISMGGMRIQRLLEPLRLGNSRMRLQFALPGEGEPIWVGAEGVYEDEHYVGLRFTHISHAHFVKLRNWISGNDV